MKITDGIETKLNNISEVLELDQHTIIELFIEADSIDTFKDDILIEMSASRSIKLQNISNESKPILEHAIKMLRYMNEIDYKKHSKDMYSKMKEIQDVNFKGRNEKVLYEVMFDVFDESIEKMINKLDKGKYSTVPKRFNDIKLVKEKLELIYKEMINDIYNKKVKQLTYYVDKHIY